MATRLEHKRKWRLRPQAAFSIQKTNAKARGIDWLLSFEEWWTIWHESGQWANRGTKSENYCMCREKDSGPYSKENVRIDTVINNKKENYILMGNINGRFKRKSTA